jgi:hypothetical protein
MMHFNFDAHLFQRQAHGGANIVQRIHRRHREIAALDPGAMAEVAAFIGAFGVPAGFEESIL